MNRNVACTLAAAALAVALPACSPDFEPASRIDKLRVLAIKAEPPEIEPAGAGTVAPDRATLESLVLRADFDAEPARTTTVVHLACLPVPGSGFATPCQTFDALGNLAALVEQVAAGACAPEPGPAPFFVGVEQCHDGACGAAAAGVTPLRRAEIAAPPPEYFDRASAPERILGIQAVVLAFAIDASPDELAQGAVTTCAEANLVAGLARLWPAREHVLATKRVTIRGPEAPDAPNENPRLSGDELGIRARSTPLDPDHPTTIAGGTITLSPVLPADVATRHEPYTKLDAAGAPIRSATEEWVFSWFATAGEIDELHTAAGESDEWTAPGAPGGAAAVVAVVVRDLRGGVRWAVREVVVTP
jgi:hypothetical protein